MNEEIKTIKGLSVISTILLIIDFVGGLVYINCSIGLSALCDKMFEMPYNIWICSCLILGLCTYAFIKISSASYT